ncbi:MAG: IclR family transcriptional regulator [Deferrisomatales bacterium]
MPSGYSAPAIHRAAEILAVLAGRGEPVRLSELARQLGYGKSSVHGLLGALEEVGWVERVGEPPGYRFGAGLVRLVRGVAGGPELLQVARPLLERLVERTGESACLGVRERDRVLILDCVEGRNELRVAARPGMTLPLLVGATGAVLLAGLPAAEARALVQGAPLVRFTERSAPTPEAFLSRVEEARARGYAVDDEEYLRGVRAVAAPVQVAGETVAALWVVGLAGSLAGETLERSVREVAEAAAAASRRLGGNGRR